MLIIKANNEQEYLAACNDGCVYGCVKGNSALHVYAELGVEIAYNPPEGVKPEKGRKFKECQCFFALSEEQLSEGYFEEDTYRGIVLIYY